MQDISRFQPCAFLTNGHLQTWLGALIPRKKMHTYSEVISLPDGDSLEIHSLPASAENAPVLFLLHGLEGSVNSTYIQGMLQVAKQRQWHAFVMHFRNHYHAGLTADVKCALQHIQSRYPHAQAMAVGYSLGANLLLKFLGENPEQTYLQAAVAVCPPFDLALTTRHLGKIYDKRFVKSLNRKSNSTAKTLYEFDDTVTAKLHGFLNADDYYQQNSCKQFLPMIKTPTLIICAADDPVIPKQAIPRSSELSPSITLEIQAHGGHNGFISCQKWGRLHYWLEDRIPEWLQQYC
ncbi:MAG: alpha/beta fold hydrolase [Gammaproteobacteria bacterium]|jgi:predicted alpha/beta-fold hydrolase